MACNGGGEVSTIFVGGFPLDATARELDNLCRFLPGFVTSNVVTAKGVTLFALFDCPPNAHQAMSVLNGQPLDRSQLGGEPMRVQMARSNMRTRGGGGGAPGGHGPPAARPAWDTPAAAPHQPPPPTAPYPGSMEGAIGKRPRIPADSHGVDTLASLGAMEAGFDEASLRSFFESLPGFVAFKGNPRMGGGFAKFASCALAQQAMDVARAEGVPAEMAKSSMSSSADRAGGWSAPALAPAPTAAYPAPRAAAAGGFGGFDDSSGGGGPLAKRPRMYEDPSQVDTVACVGAQEAGFDEASLRQFFEQASGFVAFRANPRMGGGFVKFLSSDLAQTAMHAAKDFGIPAAMAKSSMAST